MIENSKFMLHEAYCTRHNIKCEKCKNLIKKNEYENHLKDKHSGTKCQYCLENLKKPEIFKHEKFCRKRPHLCVLCKKNIPSDIYGEHYQICSKKTKKCDICNENITIGVFNKHKISCSENKNCYKCKKKFKKKDYNRHLETCEGDLKKCDKCHKKFKNRDFIEHLVVCKGDLKKCDKCEKKFVDDKFYIHYNKCGAHLKKCQKCNKLITKIDYQKHLSRCSKNDIKNNFQLSKNKFSEKSEIYNRNRNYQGIKKVDITLRKCANCNKEIPYKQYSTHFSNCIRSKKEDKYKKDTNKINYQINNLQTCEYCGTRTTKKSFNVHIKFCEAYKKKKSISKKQSLSDKRKSNYKKIDKKRDFSKCSNCLNVIPDDKFSEHFKRCKLINKKRTSKKLEEKEKPKQNIFKYNDVMGKYNEDEALARALKESNKKNTNYDNKRDDVNKPKEFNYGDYIGEFDEDEALARAIAESQKKF